MAKLSKPDLRATLRAIARGESIRPASVKGTPVLARMAVDLDQPAFAAWHYFVRAIRHDVGEPLAAPSATLTPLP